MRIHLCLGLVLVFGMSFAGLAAAEQIKRRPHDPKPNVKQPAETKKPKPANFLAGDEKWMPKPSSSASAADIAVRRAS